MAKKIVIDEIIPDLKQDWSGIAKGKEWGYKKARVEELIKRYLQGHDISKFGSVHVSTDESKLTTVRFFANDDSVAIWEEDPEAHKELVLKSISIQGAADAEEYTLVAKVINAPNSVQIAGEPNTFTFLYNSYWGTDVSDLDSIPGTVVITVNNVEVERISTEAGGNLYSVNIGLYITEEINNVKIVVSNSHGKSRTWDYLIEAKSLSIEFANSYLSSQSIAKSAGWELPIFVRGVGGTVYVSVDNGLLQYDHPVLGNSQYSFIIDSDGRFSRGTHKIEVWAEDTVYGLSSNHIYTSYIVASDSVGAAIAANAPNTITLYEAKEVPYYIYSPNDSEGTQVPVTIELYNASGVNINTRHQIVTLDSNLSSGVLNAIALVTSDEYINDKVTIKITVGNNIVSTTHELTVLAADIILHEAPECKVHYVLDNKTNTDADVVANAMESFYNEIRTSRFIRSDNFILKDGIGFTNGGFFIPALKKATLLEWQPFAVDFGVSGNKLGKTIEIEFLVGISANTETPVISCMDNKCGFEIFPTRIEIKYATSDSKIITYFPDETRIKFSLVINGTTTTCVNDDGNGNKEISYHNLAFLYVNGVMVRIFDYGVSTWNQQVIKNIVFGSDECDLTLYSIRGYDKALSMKEVLDNFSFDTPILEDKIAIAKRNNVLESDGTTINKNLIEAALPNTPIINWWVEKLPSNKKDPQECKLTDFVNPEWTTSQRKVRASFTASSHEINGDGTSSNAYPLPYKNWAEKYKDYTGGSLSIITLHLIEGDELVKKYSISYGVDSGETKFVHKVNFASSEGIFNILAMNMYHTLTLNSYNQISDLLSLLQQEQLDAGNDITFRKSLSGFPEIGFRTYTENGQIVTKFLSIYNFINNKKTGSMFGMKEDYKVNLLWEIDENVNFFNTPMTEHSVDEQGNVIYSNGVRETSPFYYSRFPADSEINKGDLGLPANAQQVSQANDEIRALRKIHNWIVSINPNVAKRYFARYGEYRKFTIAEDGFESITYAGITFTRDTPEYRALKFIDEYNNYLHLNDCIFYFIFCTYILGMDSMDKNMSLFFDTVEDFYSEDEEIRNNAKVKLRIMLRDTDTIALFNNSGVLQYKYWHEWNDTYNPLTGLTGQITGETWDPETRTYNITTNVTGSSPIFNGRLSGLWDAINNYVPAQISSIYNTMRQAGLNSNTFIEMYKKFHSYWCEALYNVDGLGYANTGRFTMAYGDKLMNSQYFFKYRERYMDSKYGYIVDSHQVTLRLSSVPNGIWMKHSIPIYASFSYGGNVATTSRSIEVGQPAYLPCTADSFNDATCYINDADLVTEIGTYIQNSGGDYTLMGLEGILNFHFTNNFNRLVRLLKFIWNNTENKPNSEQTTSNGTIDFSNLKQLKELVMTYCVNWAGSPIIGSDIIEKIDFRGTPIVSFTAPSTTTLTELHLPDSIKTLNLVEIPNIQIFDLQGINNLETINIQNSSVDGFNIFYLLYEREKSGEEIFLREVNVTVNTALNSSEFFNWLADTEINVLLSGIINAPNVVLSNTVKNKLILKFGDITSFSNKLYIIFRNVEEITYSNLKTLKNNSQLEVDKEYRIIDYTTTSTKVDVKGHNFDIIVKATSNNTLSENATAAKREGDTYFDEDAINSWELKYDIENDISKYNWADPVNGKGVIFYMKDENGDVANYDFKNIEYTYSTITIDQRETTIKVTGDTVYEIVDGVVQKKSGVTANNNVIQWIRENSHLYLSRYDTNTNKLKIALLYDGDNRYYANNGINPGDSAPITTVGNDTFMKLPTFYYKCVPHVNEQGNVVTDVWDISFSKARNGAGWNEWNEKIFIGAYEAYVANNLGYSVSGKTPTASKTSANYDTYFTERGSGFRRIGFAAHNIMAILFYAYYGTVNSQAVCGFGSSSYPKTTGLFNYKGMTDTDISNGNTTSIKFWGLDNWWGDLSEWLSGVTTLNTSGTLQVIDENIGISENVISGVSASNVTCISKMYFGERGWCIPVARVNDLNYSSGFCDGSNVANQAGLVASRSCNGAADPGGGAGFLSVGTAPSNAYPNFGSRLQYIGDYEIVETLDN